MRRRWISDLQFLFDLGKVRFDIKPRDLPASRKIAWFGSRNLRGEHRSPFNKYRLVAKLNFPEVRNLSILSLTRLERCDEQRVTLAYVTRFA